MKSMECSLSKQVLSNVASTAKSPSKSILIWIGLAMILVWSPIFPVTAKAADLKKANVGLQQVTQSRQNLVRILHDLEFDSANRPLLAKLQDVEYSLFRAETNLTEALNGPGEPDVPVADYKFACRSNYVSGALGRGWTMVEARAGAAKECLKQKSDAYCSSAGDFTCESVGNVHPKLPLNYRFSCLSNYVPGIIGRGLTRTEAVSQAGQLCLQTRSAAYCSSDGDFTCEAVDLK